MSYINDALRKAQQEKDSRYSRYSGVISGLPGPRSHKRKTWLAVAVSMTLMLAALFIWLATTSHLELPFVAKQQTHEKAVAAGHPQAQSMSATATSATGRETAAVAVVKTAAVESATPAKGTAQAAGKETSAPAAPSAVVKPPFPDPGTLYREALAAQRDKKAAVTEQLYRRILTLDAQHVQAMNNLGVLYMGQGRQEQAVVLFSKAIAIKKDYVDPYYNLACLYAQRKDAAKSIAYLKSAIAIDRSVIDWARTDMDLRNIMHLDDFKKLMENRK